ncbi:hypothetical protein Taro_052662 [Colocasia esculenta]|uniref:Uncharacterized protein n=1 Tax=Colocasia esculenta TaxID=4460 RepID=A0A843XKB4_COLES|nr:hypothetical protein [Colocasia esculenta]
MSRRVALELEEPYKELTTPKTRIYTLSSLSSLTCFEQPAGDYRALLLWPAEGGEVEVPPSSATRGHCTDVITATPWAQSTGGSTRSTGGPYIANESPAASASVRGDPAMGRKRTVYSSLLAITVGQASATVVSLHPGRWQAFVPPIQDHISSVFDLLLGDSLSGKLG